MTQVHRTEIEAANPLAVPPQVVKSLPLRTDLPIVTGAIAAVALLLGASTSLAALAEYNRTAIAGGEMYRLLSGHLVHWNVEHLLWDVLMFAILGAFVERHSRTLLLATLGLSTVSIAAAIWFLQPQMLTYRGLSGIDSALFAAAVTITLVEAWKAGSTQLAGIAALLGFAFAGKIAYEIATGVTLFVDSAAANFTPLPLVHAVGAATGAAAAILSAARSRY